MTIDIFSKDTETMEYCILWEYKKAFYYLGLLYKLLNELSWSSVSQSVSLFVICSTGPLATV